MKKFLLTILVALASLPVFARDFEYTYEGQTIKYTVLDEEAKTCETKGAYYYETNQKVAGNLIIPSIALDGETQYTVTRIPYYSFYNQSDLTSVFIPNTVLSIGNYAFAQCSSLTSVTIGTEVTKIWNNAFSGCDSMTELFYNAVNCEVIPNPSTRNTVPNRPPEGFFPSSLQKVTFGDNVETIPDYAFKNTQLTSLTIPKTVTSIGKDAFGSCNNLTEIFFNAENCIYCGGVFDYGFGGVGYLSAFPSAVQQVIIGDKVKNIPNHAFHDCSKLTSVNIPISVTSIGDGAFYNCSGLTSETIPNSVTSIGEEAFYNCSRLSSITIPNSVTSIGKRVFYGCSELSSISIPESVTEIGDEAFHYAHITELFFNAINCTSSSTFPSTLQKVNFGNNVKNVPAGMFRDCKNLEEVNIPSIEAWVNIYFGNPDDNPTYYAKKLLVNGETIRRLTIPEGTKRINAYSFINCEPLVTATYPSSLDSIGTHAFYGCTGLQRNIFPDAETYLGINYESQNARFNTGNNSKIYINSEEYNPTEIDWPATLTKIPNFAFYSNSTLRNIHIPETVTEIGNHAFASCSGLTSINIPVLVTSIEEGTFSNCSSLTSVTIPNSVTSIESEAFKNCSSLTSMTIPNSVTSIESEAFKNCSSLTSLTIPNSVTSIGSDAFNYCSSLATATLPNALTSIADGTFGNCRSLTSMIIPSSVTTIGSKAFEYCSSLTSVSVPNSVTSIGSDAFSYCSRLNHVSLQSPEVWSQVEFANSAANPISNGRNFYINDNLVKHLDIDIKDSEVSDYAFYNAINLATIRINAKSIGKYSFAYCDKATDLCLQTDSINSVAFYRCSNLKSIYCLTQEPPVTPDDAFSNYEGVTLYVPIGAASKYENAETCWWRFLDIIETDFAGIDEIFKADYENSENPDAVDSIFDDFANSEIDFSAPLEVYSLNGALIANSTDYLAPGIYIIRQGTSTKKIAIK